MTRLVVIATLLFGLTTLARASSTSLELFDTANARRLPLTIYLPSRAACTSHCRVALFGTGYQATAHEYSFLGDALAGAGYLVVIVQYDFPDEPPMPNTGNIGRDRGPYWRRGLTSLRFLLSQLPEKFPAYSWSRVTLLGHSQGGDIASLFATEHPELTEALITFDNRRVPLPHGESFPVLSLRSSDQLPDPGVLPTTEYTASSGVCILNMTATRHDDMNDRGSQMSKSEMTDALLQFVKGQVCRR